MIDILERLNSVANLQNVLHNRFKLDFNPFPKSGIASINDSDAVVGRLVPLDGTITEKIFSYIQDALFAQSSNNNENPDKYMSLIVRGEYGSGKTQTLMFIKYLIKNIQSNARPYVIYIDNPGQKLSELIGNIVSQIGVENFKKYLWGIFMSYLDKNPDVKRELLSRPSVSATLFPDMDITPNTNLIASVQNYKDLVDLLTVGLDNSGKKNLIQKLKGHIIQSLIPECESPVVASYFYDIVSETIGVSKSWDMLTTGNVKELDKREVYILKSIVKIVCGQLEYTDFIILIDEFEEITADRIKKSDVDNYLRNLRLLIDREKNWCSVFAMTSKALNMIEEYSEPLAGRIKGRIVDLKPLDKEGVRQIVANYLSIARSSDCSLDDNSIYPFDETAIEQMLDFNELNKQLKGSPRFVLKLCYMLLQRACQELEDGQTINKEFVNKYMQEMLN